MFAISSLFLPSVLLHSQQPQLVLEFWDSAQPLGVSFFFFSSFFLIWRVVQKCEVFVGFTSSLALSICEKRI